MIDRNVCFQSRQHRDRIRRQADPLGAVDFFNMLTGPEAAAGDRGESAGASRAAVSTDGHLVDVHEAGLGSGSFLPASGQWLGGATCGGRLEHPEHSHGAYCQARQRLPLEMISALTCETGRLLSSRAQRSWRWGGRAVKLVDGTGSRCRTPLRTKRAIRSRALRLPAWVFLWRGWWNHLLVDRRSTRGGARAA